MKVVLFCGGTGSRIRYDLNDTPKPLIDVCGIPIILRMMAQYAAAGHDDFILCAGHKIEFFNGFFSFIKERSVIELYNNELSRIYNSPPIQSWRIRIEDTGNVIIGERLWRIRNLLSSEEMFFANYTDVVSDININSSLRAFKEQNVIASIAAVKPSQSYHWLDASSDNDLVSNIQDQQTEDKYINGGYMCLGKGIFNFLGQGKELATDAFREIIKLKGLFAYKTDGLWKSIDTRKDLEEAETLMIEKGQDSVLWPLTSGIYDIKRRMGL